MKDSTLEKIVQHSEEEIKGKPEEWVRKVGNDWAYKAVKREVLGWSKAFC